MNIDNIDELYDAINQLRMIESEVKEYIIQTIKNKNISLEDRWNLFIQNKNLFPIRSFLVYYPEIETNDINYYDDFGYERHQTVDVVELVELIEEGDYLKFNIDLNKLKEEIMESRYSGFVFDW